MKYRMSDLRWFDLCWLDPGRLDPGRFDSGGQGGWPWICDSGGVRLSYLSECRAGCDSIGAFGIHCKP